MKRIIPLSLLLFPILLFSQTEVDITYIANEGFLVETASHKIIIDGLFNQIEGDWCDSPTDKMLLKMKNAEAPFNDIDLIAVTHNHVDHFKEDVVMQHLLSNQKAILLCPNQVYSVLSGQEEFVKVKERVVPVTPDLYSDSNLVVSEMKIRVLRLEHSHYEKVDPESGEVYNKHKDIENLGFVIETQDVKLFHCGDTNPRNEKEYQVFKLHKEGIDIAFLERQFVSSYGKECIHKINEFIQPEHIFLMHIQPSNQTYFADVFKDVPRVYVNTSMMETTSISLK